MKGAAKLTMRRKRQVSAARPKPTINRTFFIYKNNKYGMDPGQLSYIFSNFNVMNFWVYKQYQISYQPWKIIKQIDMLWLYPWRNLENCRLCINCYGNG